MGKNNSVYIPSIEANDLYCHMVRGDEIKFKHVGMIPYSLELLQLRKLTKKEGGFSTFKNKSSERELSNDVINVKFKQKVKNGQELIRIMKKKIRKLENEIAVHVKDNDDKAVENKTRYIMNITDFIKQLEREIKNPKWKGLNNEKLREYLYLKGFTITDDKGKQTTYRVYKRSSSKSRQGQCLFIKESLYNEMITWSRMNLPLKEEQKIDLPGLLAYESLVGSSLESVIKINPKNILIVEDVESNFKKLANVIRKGKSGFLESVTKKADFSNSLFDGESLLESKYFEDGVSMKLLRNHFFKSAAFSCNIQQFLIDNCPKNISFDEWKIPNMFNEKMLAKDIELIITPSSLKALKFSHVLDAENKLSLIKQQKKMFNHWKKLVRENKNTFGVCKHEKKSKHGTNDEGNVLQQLSYQMINSIPMKKSDLETLTEWERKYIKRLKDDDDFFIKYLREKANSMNCFNMFADIYEVNKGIVNAEIFRLFRSREISNYANRVKGGKVRLVADYAILLGNPLEFLYHAIGKLNKDNLTIDKDVEVLKGNEVHTQLFPVNKEYLGFRNPHTFAGNVLIVKNTYNEAINTYFNLSKNVVAINAIDFELPSILSGADYDSDSMLIASNPHLLELCKKFIHTEEGQYRNDYNVCLKDIGSDPNDYYLNKKDMAKIDNKLSLSQKYIGSVVNNGQFALSAYWNELHNGKARQELKELQGKISVSAILSEISIDLAKKSFDLDIKEEIKHIDEFSKQYSVRKEGKNKFPLFWKYVKNPKKNKTETKTGKLSFYYCPMDLLQRVMKTELPEEDHANVEFVDLLNKGDFRQADYKQEDKIWEYVGKLDKKIKSIYADSQLDKEERASELDKTYKFFNYRLKKLNVNPDTMYALLVHLVKSKEESKNKNKKDDDKSKTTTKLLKILHETQKDVFLESFKK